MAQTLAQFRDDLREHLGDDAIITWNDTQLEDAIVRAIRSAWPHFYVNINDLTTYAGANALTENTTEIAVPTSFLASGSNQPGKIHSIWCRMSDGTETAPVLKNWFRLTKGVRIDPLTQAAPKIRLTCPYSSGSYYPGGHADPCELRIVGGIPVPVPTQYTFTAAASTDVITASDTSAIFTNGSTLYVKQPGGSTLPTPLAINTLYYVVAASLNTFQVSLTLGGAAINITADGIGTFRVNSATLTGLDTITGFDLYLLWRAEEYLRSSRVKSNAYDRKAHSQRRLMAGQEADKAASRYRMQPVFETLFNQVG